MANNSEDIMERLEAHKPYVSMGGRGVATERDMVLQMSNFHQVYFYIVNV